MSWLRQLLSSAASETFGLCVKAVSQGGCKMENKGRQWDSVVDGESGNLTEIWRCQWQLSSRGFWQYKKKQTRVNSEVNMAVQHFAKYTMLIRFLCGFDFSLSMHHDAFN